VHWADTEDEATALARQGKCVALGFFEPPTLGHMELRMPLFDGLPPEDAP